VRKCNDIFLEVTKATKNEKDLETLKARLRGALGIIIMTTMNVEGLAGVGGGTGLLGKCLSIFRSQHTHMAYY
jgi:hypothetical protein